MAGGNKRPFREPCGYNANGPQIWASAFAHDLVPILRDRYVYSSTVPAPPNGFGTPVPAYERFTNVPDAEAPCFCEAHNCDPSIAPCESWIGVGTQQYNLASPPPSDYTHTPGDQKDFAVRHKRGWKGVDAFRRFHGQAGRQSNTWLAPSGGDQTTGSVTCTIPQLYQTTPDKTKFCRVDCTFSYDDTIVNASSGSGTYTATVDPNTGVRTRVGNFSYIGNPGYIDSPHDFGELPASMNGMLQQFTLITIKEAIALYFIGANPGINPALTTYSHPSPSVWIGEWFDPSTPSNNYKKVTVTCDFIGTFSVISITGTGFGPAFPTEILTDTLTLTNTTATWHWERQQFDLISHALTVDGTMDFSAVYSNPHTCDDLENDIDNNLLTLWPLNQDDLYPYRTDGLYQIAPCVCRNEVAVNVNVGEIGGLDFPVITDPMTGAKTPGTYTDNNSLFFDGAIIGAPKPAGFENTFAFTWEDWHGCEQDPAVCIAVLDWYQYGWGATPGGYNTATGSQLPLNATFWSSAFQGLNKPEGAWVMINDPKVVPANFNVSPGKDNSALWKRKFVGVQDTWRSQNMSRPAGMDKFMYDETQVVGISGLTGAGPGATFTSVDFEGNPVTITNPGGVWGGPGVGGFWNIHVSGSTVTLDTKVSSLPSDWKSASRDDGVCFGKLLYPTALSILGQEDVQWCSNETPIMIILEEPLTTLMTGDQVDVAGIVNITAANGTWTVTRVDDKTFTLNGSVGNLPPLFKAVPNPPGLVTVGNIDINNRPLVPNGEDISTVDSLTFEDSGLFILIPLVNASTRMIMTPSDAIAYYFSNGQHLGKFSDNNNCEIYAEQLHDQQDFTYSQNGLINSHGAPPVYMNDNKPKGDGGVLDWKLDYRTLSERTRLTGAVDCSSNPLTMPPANNGFSDFHQTPFCLQFTPCEPKVVCISPNGETFPNGITITLPTSNLDPQCGSRVHMWIQTTMTDIFWQTPHVPLGVVNAANGDTILWKMDPGDCSGVDSDEATDTDAIIHHRWYEHAPQVETLFAPRCGYGIAQNECPPTLPANVQLGWLSPVTHTGAGVALPPPEGGAGTTGLPLAADSAFALKIRQCGAASGCRFGDFKTGC